MGTKELEETGAEVYTFARPVNFEGDTFESLSIDFDKLTGEDILTCDRQYQMESARQSGGELIKETNKAYQAYIVARAAGVHVGLIKALPAKDFTKLTLQAQSFCCCRLRRRRWDQRHRRLFGHAYPHSNPLFSRPAC